MPLDRPPYSAAPDRYRFTLENSFDGGHTWQVFMTGDYRRA